MVLLTMSVQIFGSVGRWERGAQNVKTDVETIQQLLQLAATMLNAPQVWVSDGAGH